MKGCNVLLQRKARKSITADVAGSAAKTTKKADASRTRHPKLQQKQMTVPPGFQVQLAAGEPTGASAGCFHDGPPRPHLGCRSLTPIRVRAPEGRRQGQDHYPRRHRPGRHTLDSRKEFITGLNLVSGTRSRLRGRVGWCSTLPHVHSRSRTADDVPDGQARDLTRWLWLSGHP